MSLTFTPKPGAAPLWRMVFAQSRMEAKLMVRNGEQLLLAVVIPIIVLVGGIEGARHISLNLSHRPVDEFTPGVLALAVMSTSFTSLAIATGFERRYGVIKRLGSSPLPRAGLLAGKIGGLVFIEILQLVVLGLVGLVFRWHPHYGATGTLGAVLAVVLGTAAFASLGLFLAGVLRAEATLAAANLVYLLLLAGGGVVIPASSYGGFAVIARLLPSGALGDAMRNASLNGSLDVRALAVLFVWAVIGTVATTRTFQWE